MAGAQVRARMDLQIEAPDPEKFPWEKLGYLTVQVRCTSSVTAIALTPARAVAAASAQSRRRTFVGSYASAGREGGWEDGWMVCEAVASWVCLIVE